MVRIRGSIGDWPVDLTLELDAEDWRQLAQHVPPPPLGEPQAAAARAPAPAAPVDRLWQTAQDLLRGSGRIEGPQLLAELEGSAAMPAPPSNCWCACGTTPGSRSRWSTAPRCSSGWRTEPRGRGSATQ